MKCFDPMLFAWLVTALGIVAICVLFWMFVRTPRLAERNRDFSEARFLLIRAASFLDDDAVGLLDTIASLSRGEMPERDPRDLENRALRRMLCAVYAGASAYMDDGEAQDNRTQPFIDFLRDTPEEIQRKLFERGSTKLAMQEPISTGRDPAKTRLLHAYIDANGIEGLYEYMISLYKIGTLPQEVLASDVSDDHDICGTCDGRGCPVCKPTPEPHLS